MSNMQALQFCFVGHETKPCRIAKPWMDSGKTGIFFGTVIVSGVRWAAWNDAKLGESRE